VQNLFVTAFLWQILQLTVSFSSAVVWKLRTIMRFFFYTPLYIDSNSGSLKTANILCQENCIIFYCDLHNLVVMRGKAVKLVGLSRLFLFLGSSVTLAVGLLAAFVPGLSYVTLHSYFLDVPNPPFGLPYVSYPPLVFATHMYTARLLVSATGGLIGLFALFGKSKQSYIGVVAIAVANVGLMLPVIDTRLTFPEMSLIDVPWVGSFLVLSGVCLMFLGLTMHKVSVPRVTFLSVPLLLAGYSVTPLLVLTNNLQLSGFRTWSTNPISLLMLSLMVAGYLLMTWGCFKDLLPKK
jgi:hypothetical protein